MVNKLPKHHLIFSVENPVHPVSAKSVPTTEEMTQHLNDMGEDAQIIHGNYGGVPERSILVTNPQNVKGIHAMAAALGQESILHSKNGSHELHYLNGPQAGTSVYGKGTQFFHNAPETNYSTIHTEEGPLHFSHNLEFPEETQKSEMKRHLEEDLEKAPIIYEQEPDFADKKLKHHAFRPDYHKEIKTAKLKNGLFHHIYKPKENKNYIIHSLSNGNPKEPLAIIAGNLNDGTFVANTAATREDVQGKGLGTGLKALAAKYHGIIESDYITSPAEHASWKKLANIPKLKVYLGETQDDVAVRSGLSPKNMDVQQEAGESPHRAVYRTPKKLAASEELEKDRPKITFPNVPQLPTRPDQEVMALGGGRGKAAQRRKKIAEKKFIQQGSRVYKKPIREKDEKRVGRTMGQIHNYTPGGKGGLGGAYISYKAPFKLTGEPTGYAYLNEQLMHPKDERGQNKGLGVTQHEALHYLLGQVSNEYGEHTRNRLVSHLVRHLGDAAGPIANYIKGGYNPNSPHFKEEVLTHAHDLLVDPRTRSNMLMIQNHARKRAAQEPLKPEDLHPFMSSVKRGWSKVVNEAKKITPEHLKHLQNNPTLENFKSDLAASEDLDKGAQGDWKKEGYTFDHKILEDSYNPDVYQNLLITAHDQLGNKVGRALISVPVPGMGGAPTQSLRTSVHADHRRKGLASAMYQHAENILGTKLSPGDLETDGRALWSQSDRPFGKQEDLNKTPLKMPPMNTQHMNEPDQPTVRVKKTNLPNGLVYEQLAPKSAKEGDEGLRYHHLLDPKDNTRLAFLETRHMPDAPHSVMWGEVNPEYRGHGLGRQLYLATALHLKHLHSDDTMTPKAHAMWQSFKDHPGMDVQLAEYGKPNRHYMRVEDPSKIDYGKMFPKVNLNKSEELDKGEVPTDAGVILPLPPPPVDFKALAHDLEGPPEVTLNVSQHDMLKNATEGGE